MKKILYVGPKYFNYHLPIKRNLEKLGFHVDYIDDWSQGVWLHLSWKVHFIKKIGRTYFQNKIKKALLSNEYEYFFVIRGESLDEIFFKSIEDIKLTHRILYEWDSLKNFNYKSYLPYFDKVYTFDRFDAINFDLQYLPLFYIQENIDLAQRREHNSDILFVASWHSDRAPIAQKVVVNARSQNLNVNCKIYMRIWNYFINTLTKKIEPNWELFTFQKISTKNLANMYANTKCILDVNHPEQSGLTMRTIETLGFQKSIITTNKNIKYEPFYNEKLVQIIPRDNPKVDPNVVNSHEKYEHREIYEISNWAKIILGIIDNPHNKGLSAHQK